MSRWPRFSSDLPKRLTPVVALAAIPLGIVAESLLYGWGDLRHAVPDVVTGWALVAGGLVLGSRRVGSRAGALLAATGFTWFAGNFTDVLLYLHRGPLIQLVLTYPHGRVRGRRLAAAVAVGYAVSVAAPVWRSNAVSLVLAMLLVVVAFGTAPGRTSSWAGALPPAAFLGTVLAAIAVARLVTPNATEATLLVYEAALCFLTVGLVATIGRPRAHVADLVVELGERRTGLRNELAAALGDPSLLVAYPLPDGRGHVDASGHRIEVTGESPTRRVTRLEVGGREIVTIVHDAAVLDDPDLLEAAAGAARLGGVNAHLQAQTREQLVELARSRRRLLAAAEEEQRRLELRIRHGPSARLAAVAQSLQTAARRVGPDTRDAIRRVERQLARALAELEALGRGLHPHELAEGGLAEALPWLVEGVGVPVDVVTPDRRLPPQVEATAYFVCAEALANVAKHAAATSVDVRVTVDAGAVVVAVIDDGAGGAAPSVGTGLAGLADRVEALGGTLIVESPPGAGTRVEAVIPFAP